jgi:thioredoxin reductase
MRVAILGAGPAGMSCANACLSFGLEPVVIERADHVGGTQRGNFHPNLWMLGYPDESGQEMTRRISTHFLDLPLSLHQGTELVQCRRDGTGFLLELRHDGQTFSMQADAIVLATGMRPRATPELAALAAQTERVIIGPLNDAIRDRVRDSRVLILGGGDNALDHALFLAERGNRVRVCTRRAFSARKPFLASCARRPEVELRENCVPDRIGAEEAGTVRVGWGRITVRYDWLLVMYGYVPNVDILERFELGIRPELTATGHLHVDKWQRTTVAGLYAAGDITDNPQPSVPTAIAQGLAAAKAIERDAQRQG